VRGPVASGAVGDGSGAHARRACRVERPGRGFAPPRTPPHQRLKAFGNLKLGTRKGRWCAWMRGHAEHRPLWARPDPSTPETRSSWTRRPLAGWFGGALPDRRDDCAAANDQGGALPLPGPRPTKGLRPLETSHLALARGGGVLGRGAMRGAHPAGHSCPAGHQLAAVQGPAGPWRGGLEGQRPSNLRPHASSRSRGCARPGAPA
jgi:hypothetical protein